jgi:hypothetical protein
MTEADLLEVATSTYGLAVDGLSFYMTVTTAYLIAVYLVGAKLTRFQMTVISTLYVIMTGVSTYALDSWLKRGVYYMAKARALDADSPIYANAAVAVIMTATLVAGIFACLLFMWSIRHPKPERLQ